MGRRNVKDLNVARRFNNELFAATESHIDILTQNNGKKAHYALHIFEDFEQNRTIGPIFIPTLQPGQTAQAPYDCIFPSRGSARFRQIQIRSRFPVPLFEFRAEYPCEDKATVYPQRLPERDLVRFSASAQDEHGASWRRSPRIQALDNGRLTGRILWKLSARRGTLIEEVRKPTPAGASHVVALTPKSALPAAEYERQISQVTDFCLCSLENGDPVALEHNDQITPGNRRELLEFLSHV